MNSSSPFLANHLVPFNHVLLAVNIEPEVRGLIVLVMHSCSLSVYEVSERGRAGKIKEGEPRGRHGGKGGT